MTYKPELQEKTIRIFISSPGDVAEEREKAREVVRRLQRRYLGRLKLVSILWEDLFLGADISFQEGIERILSQDGGIDIAVFIFWSRLGSPLGSQIVREDGTLYRSGTEREFDLMLQAREASLKAEGSGRPEILAYFRNDEEEFHLNQRGKSTTELKQMVEQRELVEQFIQENFYDETSGTNIRAFHNFDIPTTFANRLRVHLQNILDEKLKDAHLSSRGWDISQKGAPYQGLEAFDVEHEDIFFGREQEISDVQVALDQQAQKGNAFVLLVGASGSGKSSLARAGVIPALRYFETDPVIYRHGILTPGQYAEDLFSGLAQTLTAATALPEHASSGQSLPDLAAGLCNDPQTAYNLAIKSIFQKIDDGSKEETRLLLLIDQMEELFTHTRITPETVTQFIRTLEILSATGKIRILATLRSDFYAKIQDYPNLVNLKEGKGQYDLLPPQQAHLHRIITEPAYLSGIQFEEIPETGERLDQLILNDAIDHPEALPLLEYTLRELFENRTQEGMLTFKLYEALGGVEGALGKRAEETYNELPESTQQIVKKLFRSLTTVSDEQEFTSKPVTLSDYLEQSREKELDMNLVLESFIQARLLISHKNEADEVVIRLSHEALIRSWPRLNQWLVDARDFIEARARLDQSLKHWIEKGCSDDLLLAEGINLEEAKNLQIKWPDELTAEQLDYIRQSVQFHENKRTKRVRMYQAASVVFLILTVLAMMGGGLAWWQSNRLKVTTNDLKAANINLDKKTKIAEAQTKKVEKQLEEANHNLGLTFLTKADLSLKEMDVNSARLYSLYALKNLKPDAYDKQAQARSVMLNYPGISNVFTSPTANQHEESVTSIAYSPDGCYLASGSQDNTIKIWDLVTGKEKTTLKGHLNEVTSVSYSPDGRYLASGSNDNTVKIWDLNTGKETTTLIGHLGRVISVSYSPDGHYLASGSNDKTIRIWDLNTGKEKATLKGNWNPVAPSRLRGHHFFSLSYSPDGRYLASGSDDKTIKIWDLATGKETTTLKGHSGRVRSVSYSPDGRYLASGSNDNTVKIWDLATGKEKATLKGHVNEVTSVSYSPDGRYLASGSDDKTIKIWDLATGKETTTLKGHSGRVRSVSYSPDGRYLASGSNDNTVKIWDLATGKEKATLKGHVNEVTSVSYSPDGHYLASGSSDSTVKIWNLATGKEKVTLKGHSSGVTSVCYSPDGHYLASGSNDSTVKIWNLVTGKEKVTLKGHSSWVRSVSYSPNGRYLASGSWDSIKIWDLRTGKEKITLNGHSNGITSVSYSPDGHYLASGSNDSNVKIWDLATGKEKATLKGHLNVVTSVSYSPDGHYLASGADDHSIVIWDLATGKERAVIRVWDRITSVSYSPDGRYLTSGNGDNTIKIWDLTTGKEKVTLKGHSNRVTSVSYSPNGRCLASGSDDKTVKIWDLATRKEKVTLKGYLDEATCVSYSPDGRYLASGSDDKTIKIWDLTTGKEKVTLKGHSNEVTSVSYSPNGRYLASGDSLHSYRNSQGDNNTIKIWDLAIGKEKATFKGHSKGISSVSYSPDGHYLASGSWDHTIKIWNLATGKEKATLKGHSERVTSVSYSPDGHYLASGSWDHTIKIWNLATGKEKATLKGHSNEVTSVSYSPDGHYLASGSWDHTIKIWNLATGKEKAILKGHVNEVTSVSYSPDGRYLASGSNDKTVKIWDLATGKEKATLKGHSWGVTSVCYSPDGHYLASGDDSWLASKYGAKTIRIWDVSWLHLSVSISNQIKNLEKQYSLQLEDLNFIPKQILLKDIYATSENPAQWSTKSLFYLMGKADSGDVNAMYELGILYDQSNEMGKALFWYNKAAQNGLAEAKERQAEMIPELIEKAEKFIGKENWQSAIDSYNSILKSMPTDDSRLSETHRLRGYCKSNIGQFKEALSDYNKALEIDDQNVEAYSNRAWALMQLHDYDKAIEDLRKVVEFVPEFGDAHGLLGWLLIEQNRLQEAEHPCREAHRLDPENYGWAVNLGHLHLLKNEEEQAYALYDIALNQIPDQEAFEKTMADFELFIGNGWQVERCQKAMAWMRSEFNKRKDALSSE